MSRILVTGNGTDVGKTIVSGVLATLFQGDYWKPIQCGDSAASDYATMKEWLDPTLHVIHPPAYSLKAPLSPHHAARLEDTTLDLSGVIPPNTRRPLIIEGVGGLLVPLNTHVVALDLFEHWHCEYVVVSRHYIGSINHTLLTIEALKRRGLPIRGLIFNGEPNPDSEAAILAISGLSLLGRLLPEACINSEVLKQYGKQWRQHFFPPVL